MSVTFDLILEGGTLVNHDGTGEGDIGIRDGRIAAMGDLSMADADRRIDATGLHVLPGVIDTHAHFREPGFEYKEDFATGSLAAVLGGVTAVFDMPNTVPPTTGAGALEDKLKRAVGRMFCDYAFHIGATPENADSLGELERLPGAAGVKMFMGKSTGNLLVDQEEDIKRVLAAGRRRIAVHCEDERRLKELAESRTGSDVRDHPNRRDVDAAVLATTRLLRLAREARRRVHVLHLSTAIEVEILTNHRDIATVEVTPQHLTLSAPDCYDCLGNYAQMNPPIRVEEHLTALWAGLRGGIIDVLGSDHAPHTREEKSLPYPESPSGMPGIQTMMPIMLDHVNAGYLSLQRLVDLTSAGPARVFGIAGKGRMAIGFDADFTLVDLKAKRKIDSQWLASKCGWSPFTGRTVTGWPMGTIVRGHAVMWDGEADCDPPGRALRFEEAL